MKTCLLAVALLPLMSASAVAQFTLIEPAGFADVAPSSTPPFLHWDLRRFADCKVPFAVNANGTADMPLVDAQAEVIGTFSEWRDVLPAILDFNDTGLTTNFGLTFDNWNVVSWDNDLTNGDAWDPDLIGGAIGITCFTSLLVGHGELLEVDIVLDDAQFTWTKGTQDFPTMKGDIKAVLMHEVGHLFGFGENNATGTGAERVETVDGPFTFVAGDTLSFTVGPPGGPGTAVTVTLPVGTASGFGLAAAINVAAAGAATATPTASGSVRIDAPLASNEIIVTGGTALAKLQLQLNESGISTMNQPDPRGKTSLDQGTPSRADQDGINFLYSPDLGDAPDPFLGPGLYPTLVHTVTPLGFLNGQAFFFDGEGPVHAYGVLGGSGPRYEYEWLGFPGSPLSAVGIGGLGGIVDGDQDECEALLANGDRYDDGVVVHGAFTPGGPPTAVDVYVRTAPDVDGGSHSYAATGNELYLNLWFDWNANGSWFDPVDWVVVNDPIQPSALPSTTKRTYLIAAPAGAVPGGWARVRLDWREGAGFVAGVDPSLFIVQGLAQSGEVEDYAIPYAGDAWSGQGPGKQGAFGTPKLVGSGPLTAGTVAQIVASDGPSFTNAFLLVGFGQTLQPFKGGILGPNPDILQPLPLDGSGSLVLATIWPAGIPPGIPLWWQVWIIDSAATLGFSATNTLLSFSG